MTNPYWPLFDLGIRTPRVELRFPDDEALVAVAGLALIDMVKGVDPGATITDVRVEEKTGGKTGLWRRDGVT